MIRPGISITLIDYSETMEDEITKHAKKIYKMLKSFEHLFWAKESFEG